MSEQRGYTLRFWLYATAHGKDPCDMDAGSNSNVAFINWCRARWRQWSEITGRTPPWSNEDHKAFDTWLKGWVGALPQEAATEQAELFR